MEKDRHPLPPKTTVELKRRQQGMGPATGRQSFWVGDRGEVAFGLAAATPHFVACILMGRDPVAHGEPQPHWLRVLLLRTADPPFSNQNYLLGEKLPQPGLPNRDGPSHPWKQYPLHTELTLRHNSSPSSPIPRKLHNTGCEGFLLTSTECSAAPYFKYIGLQPGMWQKCLKSQNPVPGEPVENQENPALCHL